MSDDLAAAVEALIRRADAHPERLTLTVVMPPGAPVRVVNAAFRRVGTAAEIGWLRPATAADHARTVASLRARGETVIADDSPQPPAEPRLSRREARDHADGLVVDLVRRHREEHGHGPTLATVGAARGYTSHRAKQVVARLIAAGRLARDERGLLAVESAEAAS